MVDKWGVLINDKTTYKYVANKLKDNKSVLISWTDQKFTQYDILFNTNCVGNGMYQGGIKKNDLFVSIMRLGSFGFKIDSKKYPSYVAEKLFFKNYSDESIDGLTELINGICEELKK